MRAPPRVKANNSQRFRVWTIVDPTALSFFLSEGEGGKNSAPTRSRISLAFPISSDITILRIVYFTQFGETTGRDRFQMRARRETLSYELLKRAWKSGNWFFDDVCWNAVLYEYCRVNWSKINVRTRGREWKSTLACLGYTHAEMKMEVSRNYEVSSDLQNRWWNKVVVCK